MHGRVWWSIGWRNLGRNTRRTILTASGLAVGYFSVVILSGLSEGITADMITNATAISLGQIQIHHEGFLPERDIYATVGSDALSPDSIMELAVADPLIPAASPRVYGAGLVSAGDATLGGMLMGIDVDRERQVTRLLDAIVDGRAPQRDTYEVLLGREMASQLGVHVGDEVIVVAQAADGSLGNDLFTVSGTFATGVVEQDLTLALFPIGVLQDLIVIDRSRVHEIAARVDNPWQAPEAAARLAGELPASSGLAVEPWTELRPELVDYAQLASAGQWIMLLIVFAMALFGVANTVLMSTFERRREFALLLALGTSPWGVIRSVLWEAVAMGVLSVGAGVVITVPVLVLLHYVPLDLSRFIGGFTMAGTLVRPVFRTDYPWAMLGVAAVALVSMALMAAAYPALRAVRVQPAEVLSGR
jgi:putative ABC transport system permease protein